MEKQFEINFSLSDLQKMTNKVLLKLTQINTQ